RPGVRPLTLVRIKLAVCGERDRLPRGGSLSFYTSALFCIFCRCVAYRGTPHDRSADRWPACRILLKGAAPPSPPEGRPRGRRRHSGTRSALLRSHYERLGVRLVRLPADQLQGGMGWTGHAVDLRWGPRVAAANPRRRAIPPLQRTVQRDCAPKRSRILAAIPHALHSTRGDASVERLCS